MYKKVVILSCIQPELMMIELLVICAQFLSIAHIHQLNPKICVCNV